MIESYRVGIALVVESNVARVIGAAAEQFKLLDSTVRGTQASVNELAASMRVVGRVGASAAREWQGAARAMDRAAAAAAKAAAAMRGVGAAGFAAGAGGMGGGPGPRVNRPSGSPAQVAGMLGYYGQSNGAVVPYAAAPGAPVEPPGTARAGRSMTPSSAPWVDRAIGGGAPPPRGPGDEPFLGPEDRPRYVLDPRAPRRHRRHVGLTHMAVTDWVGFEAGKSIFSPTFDEAREESLLLGMGFTQKQVEQAYLTADKTRKTAPGSSVLGNMSITSQLMAITQNADTAVKATPDFAKFAVAMNSVSPGHGHDMTQALMAAMRGGEYRGVLTHTDAKTGKETIDIKGMSRWLHLAETMAYISHGTVGPQQVFQYLRSSGIAGSQQSDASLIRSLALQIAMTSSGAGHGLQSFAQQFQAGKMAKGTYTLLQDLGLVSKDPKTWRKLGIGYVELLPGAMPQAERRAAADHPDKFVLNYVEPRIKKYLASKYGKEWTLPNATPEQRQKDQLNLEMSFLQEIASRQPGGRWMAEIVRNHLLMNRDFARGAERMGLDPATFQPKPGQKGFDQFQNQVANNPYIKVAELEASWQAMMISIGKTDLKPAVKTLDDLSHIIDALGKFASSNPTAARVALDGLVLGFVGFNAAMAGKGIFMAGKFLVDIAKGVGKVGVAAEAAVSGVGGLAGVLETLIGVVARLSPLAVAAGIMHPAAVGGQHGEDLLIGKGGLNPHRSSVNFDPADMKLLPFTPFPHSSLDKVTLPHDADHGVNGRPVNVRIINTRALLNGITGGIANQSREPQGGYSGTDLKADPFAAGSQSGLP